MIEEFGFSNFWSFRDLQTLNMTAARIKSKPNVIDSSNIFPVSGGMNLLKTKAIYGANASGKSNVVRALAAFIRIITDSVKEDRALELIDSFALSTTTEGKPTFFQLIFRIDNVKYRYGFEADHTSVKSEWLFATPNKREQTFFIREGLQILEINQTHFKEGSIYQKLFENSEDPIFRPTSLFLTHLAATGFGKLSKRIVNAISSITIISGLDHQGMYQLAGDALNDLAKKKFILDFLKKGDTGINDLKTVEINSENFPDTLDESIREELINAKIIVASKVKYDANFKPVGNSEFSLSLQESEGTKKMFEISPFIYKSITEGTPLIIDEFDSRFHPLLSQKIIELYNSMDNPNAQLIFTTHNTNLLSADLLRRDQIDFVEKDTYGASRLYTLVEIKGIRNDASFEKDYIQGKYGAVPYLGRFSTLLNTPYG